jgi:Protein of unknown function (DUF3305)
MSSTLKVPLGVVVARERLDNPWQDVSWRPSDVFLGAEPITEWRRLRDDGRVAHYHIATLDLELHPKETAGYLVNLENGPPSVYVVLRYGSDTATDSANGTASDPASKTGTDNPIHVHLITASPFDVQAYGHNGDEIIAGVDMPDLLAALFREFVAEHHVEEAFVKRQRVTTSKTSEPHIFGQEPVQVLRERMEQTEAVRAEATGIAMPRKPRP